MRADHYRIILAAAPDGGTERRVTMRLNESDLKFIVETVATRRRDHDHIIGLVRGKDDLLEPMLDEPKLAERLVREREAFARVSPYLLFAALLRRVRRDLEGRSFVLRREAGGKPVPVFAAPQAVQLLGDSELREYLAEMLCSFVRVNSGVLRWRERGMWRKRKFSDVDLDDLMALCRLVEPSFKPRLYKRIADLALFLTGVYPDHASFVVRRSRSHGWRRVPDYEREGRRFYSAAAREPQPSCPASVFEYLAEKFARARGVLNTLNDRYHKPLREQYFARPAG